MMSMPILKNFKKNIQKTILFATRFVNNCNTFVTKVLSNSNHEDNIKKYNSSMSKYIFYTAEGYTCAPNKNYEVENCQVLGTAMGKDNSEAQNNLLKDNPWILKAGFSPSKFIVREIIA